MIVLNPPPLFPFVLGKTSAIQDGDAKQLKPHHHLYLLFRLRQVFLDHLLDKVSLPRRVQVVV